MSESGLRRFTRVIALLLLVTLIISVISGWGVTRTEIIYKASFGLIDRRLAFDIHRATQIPIAALFLVHVLANVKLGLASKPGLKAGLVNVILIALGILLLAGVVYMEVSSP